MNRIKALFGGWAGRIGRGQFWLGALLVFVVSLLLVGLFALAGQGVTTTQTGTVQVDGGAATEFWKTQFTLNPLANLVVSLVSFALTLPIGIKRRHDRNASGIDLVALMLLSLLSQVLTMAGWMIGPIGIVLSLVSTIGGIYLFIVLGCLKGTTGANQYGPDPLAQTP